MNRTGLFVLIVVLIGAAMLYAGYRQGIFGATARYLEGGAEHGLYRLKARGTTLDGSAFDSDLLRGKVLVVNIFATWCPPCVRETPDLVNLFNELNGRGLEMVMVTEEPPETVRPFAERHAIPYPIIVNGDDVVSQVPGFQGYPTTIVLDRAGTVRYQIVGAHVDRIRSAVMKLLDEKQAATRPAAPNAD
jgi:thiol-disulfide isomerase/thioredoxin